MRIHNDVTPGVRTMRVLMGKGATSLAFLIGISLFLTEGASPVRAQDAPSSRALLLKAAAQMRTANAALAKDTSVENRIRALSWTLLVAEMAGAKGGPELYTASADAFETGIKQLQALEHLVKTQPAVKAKIDGSPKLAMRLDTVRVRLTALQRKAALSRTEERRRLDACRQLIRAYRKLTANLAASNAQSLMGDHDSASKQYAEAASRLAELEKIVGQPRMHWIFKDEPRLNNDKNTEADLILAAPDPFSDDMLAHLKAVQALSAYRKAVAADSTIKDADLLAQARKWATESLDAGKNAAAADASRVIPVYVLAQAERCLGLQITRKSPLSDKAHKDAARHFDAARESFDSIAATVTKADGPFGGIRSEVARRVAELKSPAPFLANGAKLIARGLNTEGVAEFGRGLAYHRSLSLLLARAEAASRNPKQLAHAITELQQAAADGLLPADDPLSQLVSAKCVLAQARRRLAGGKGKALADADRSALKKSLDGTADKLVAMQKKTASDSVLRSRLDAYRALARSLSSMLGGKAGDPEKAALQLAKSTAESLEIHLKAAKDGDEVVLREDLVAARIAQGHLAVRALPDYRDTSMLAFTAAMDQQSRLPYAGADTRLLGGVLMESLLKRSDTKSSRLALEERQLRMLMTQFTEGLFPLYWNRPQEASDRMDRALGRLSGSSKKPSVDLKNVSQFLAASNASTDTLESVVAFSAMSHVAAERSTKSLVVMLNHLAGDDPLVTSASLPTQLTKQRLESALGRVESPLVGYAFGLALESAVVQKSGMPAGAIALCRQYARASQHKVQRLLASSPGLRDRYKFVAASNTAAYQRLTSQQPFLDAAKRLSQQFRFAEARASIRRGLQLHPGNERLLADLFRLTVDQAAVLDTKTRQAVLSEAMNDITRQNAAAKPTLAFNAARILDMSGRRRDAVAAYRVSLRDAAAPQEQKVVAESRIALLSALTADN